MALWCVCVGVCVCVQASDREGSDDGGPPIAFSILPGCLYHGITAALGETLPDPLDPACSLCTCEVR